MGRSSDWDDLRTRLHDVDSKIETCAIEIKKAADWGSGIKQLATEIPAGSILVGYSMGARIALALAIEYPQKIAGLIFVSGNPGLETEDARSERLAADLRLADQMEDLKDQESIGTFLNRWYQQFVFDNVPDYVKIDEIRRKSKLDISHWAILLRTFSVGRQPNFWPRLKELSIPFCAVAGEADEKYKGIASRIATGFSSSVVIQTVAECGHIVHREKPDELVHIVRNFLGGGQEYAPR